MRAALLLLIVGVVAIGEAQPPRLLGFATPSLVLQRERESTFAAGISIDRIAATHRAITDRPHMAGTHGGRHIATVLRDRLREAGLDADFAEYRAYLSTPREVSVRLTAPTASALRVDEPAHPDDPDSRHPDLTPGFVAYSASGSVEAPVAYVNYGLPADYDRLDAAGVDVRGKIVLARYGRSHRAVKIFTAEQRGAAGIVIYSDPADDGESRGQVWPQGRWRAPFQLQRGNGKYSWFWHGDALTPGRPASPGATPLDAREVPTLPRIPAVVLAADEARQVLRHLEGPAAPEGFSGGLALPYRLGPGPATVRMSVAMENGARPIYNVIGQIAGASQPERWVMLGTHHDAWTFGATDPGSAVAVLAEVARGLAALARSGWKPARTIVFCFWDAEEFGLVGSTEYAEDRARELREKAVAYINTDMYMAGTLVAGGVASLRDFVAEVARDVPGEGGSLLANWIAAERLSRRSGEAAKADAIPELRALGSGADFVAFQDFLGLPTLSLELLTPSGWSFGTYHSAYDTRWAFERHGDPGYRQAPRLAQVLGFAAIRLADADVLPFRFGHYGERIEAFVEEAEQWRTSAPRPSSRAGMDTLRRVASEVTARGRALDRAVDRVLERPIAQTRGCRQSLNDGLARIEQALLSDEGDDRHWYRHTIYGWNIYALYDGQPLPRIADAIRRQDQPAVDREIVRVHDALARMRDALERVAGSCH
jgi:N-acetylated-alpha-linked acidic dipeptidase